MIKAQDNGDPPKVDTRQFNISINGNFPPSTDKAGLSTDILIAVIIVTVTIDRDRQKKQAEHTNTEDRMYQVNEHVVFRNLSVGGAGDEDSNSNNLSNRQKKAFRLEKLEKKKEKAHKPVAPPDVVEQDEV
ncbi:hypothetical protein Btru_026204 [Bulinus truncatus]|nr:hypothetical protein Btru_026204 [Bulinus truncatus]